jgi:hypothetical protein
MRRGTGKQVLTIVAVVAGGTWLFKKAGLNVPGFTS